MKKLFSLVALAGLLAACQLERLESAYSLGDAVATINVNVVDISTGTAPEGAVISASDGTCSGTTVTITGNPVISEMDVDVTVRYNDRDYTETVHINTLLAGGIASYSVTVLVGEISEGAVAVTYESVSTEYEYIYSEDGPYKFNYTHGEAEIGAWYLNNTAYLEVLDVDFVVRTGSTVADLSVINPNYEITINTIYNAYDSYKTVEVSTQFTISAHCYYNVLVTYKKEYVSYDVNLVDENYNVLEVIGTFTKCTYSTAIEAVEVADESGQYEKGHGIGYNAGGGIVFSE